MSENEEDGDFPTNSDEEKSVDCGCAEIILQLREQNEKKERELSEAKKEIAECRKQLEDLGVALKAKQHVCNSGSQTGIPHLRKCTHAEASTSKDSCHPDYCKKFRYFQSMAMKEKHSIPVTGETPKQKREDGNAPKL
ncbi:hypothetical protein AVEN_202999-1 [Araneus ventricosus]|uniref:Uncharacterized protein n=1 Tax=Araneus ventricosus TaxID=182803 RepID=A0A4Y2ENH5_ARAVE|nr:hypothetical protein AVEN_202999-1 [Araneus ventricosus]